MNVGRGADIREALAAYEAAGDGEGAGAARTWLAAHPWRSASARPRQ